MLWDRPMRCSLTAKKNHGLDHGEIRVPKLPDFEVPGSMLGFSGEESQKTEDSKKNHPEPQTAGSSFYLEDGT